MPSPFFLRRRSKAILEGAHGYQRLLESGRIESLITIEEQQLSTSDTAFKLYTVAIAGAVVIAAVVDSPRRRCPSSASSGQCRA